MGHTLKLDIYYFTLKKITEEYSRKVRGGEIRTCYKTEEKESIFKDVLSSLYPTKDKKECFRSFLQDFISIFSDKFTKNESNTQAMSITNDLYRGLSENDYTIWGEFIGGPTGIDWDIYKANDAKRKKDTLGNDSVASLSFFYKIWMPYDDNTGILMLQSYTTSGCSYLYRNLLSDFFVSKGYSITWTKCIPKQYIDKYISNSFIHSIRILTKKRIDNSFTPTFSAFKEAKRSTCIKNISLTIDKLLSYTNYIDVLKSQIATIDLNFDKENDELMLYYKDHQGRKAHSTLSNIENMLPSIILDDTLKDPTTQKPLWNELHLFTQLLLEKIKKEISYTPTQR